MRDSENFIIQNQVIIFAKIFRLFFICMVKCVVNFLQAYYLCNLTNFSSENSIAFKLINIWI